MRRWRSTTASRAKASKGRRSSVQRDRWRWTAPAGRRADAGEHPVVTSNPTRTSPVKRGKWILENILGTPPPPPPPDVRRIEGRHRGVAESDSLRQRMEQHRSKPICAVCHNAWTRSASASRISTPIGGWRTQDGKFADRPVRARCPTGQKFQGPAELKVILKSEGREFRRCLTEKMLTYALGRGLERYDRCHGRTRLPATWPETRLSVFDPGARDREERPVPEASKGR